MPIYIVPTPSTAKAWRQSVKRSLRVELVTLSSALMCLCFGSACAAVSCSEVYTMIDAATYVAYVSINIACPVFALLFSSLHIYLYTSRTLRPSMVFFTTALLTLGWIACIGVWLWMFFTNGINNWIYYTWALNEGGRVPWPLLSLQVLFGLIAAITTFIQFIFAIIALRRRKNSKEVDPPEADHCPSCSRLISHVPPPKAFDYEDLNYSIYDSTTGVTTGVTCTDDTTSAGSRRSAHTAPSIIVVGGSPAPSAPGSMISAPSSRARSYGKHPVSDRCHCGACSGDNSTIGDESV